MVFIADDLAAWLVGALADAGLKRIAILLRGSDQERALRGAATAAVQSTVKELCPDHSEQAENLRKMVNRAFIKTLVPSAPVEGHVTLREALHSGIARQLTSLGDPSPTCTGHSSTEVLDISVTLLGEKLTGHLLEEIEARGAFGGPLEPLANQLNHDTTHLELQDLQTMVGRLDDEVRQALAQRDADPAGIAAQPKPCQLPWDDDHSFIGRDAELKWLRDHSQPVLDGAGGRVLSIIGMPAVGKSALAVRFAHVARKDFDDAQLYADLRPPDHSALKTGDVLARFLRALGVTNPPDDEVSREDLYLSLVADKRVLVVLDDAQSSDQVRPLLPGGEHCLTLVTSRTQLGGLEGADCLRLTELAPEPAQKLLRLIADDEVLTADSADMAELARLCGYLPLALRIAAVRLRGRHWSARKLVTRLSDERQRLAELQVEGLHLRPHFVLSYEELDDRERLLFRRTFMTSPVTTETAAALIATDEEIADAKARQEDQEHLIRAEAGRLAAARRITAEPKIRPFSLAAEVRCPDVKASSPEVLKALQGLFPNYEGHTPPAESFQVRARAIHQVLQDVMPDDADITPTADGFLVRATLAGASDDAVFRTLSAPVCDAGPPVDIKALVRAPEGQVSEFADSRTAGGKTSPRSTPDPVLAQALSDATQTLGAEVPPYLDCDEAEELLGTLANKQLAQPVEENSYRIHDLLRAFAREVFDRDDEATEHDLLSRRLFCALTRQGRPIFVSREPHRSPMEEARRHLRIAATAERLGVSDWVTSNGVTPLPPGSPWPDNGPSLPD